jgi:hypothetical protein
MSKLREAAQALLDAYVADTERWMTPYWDALREALAEDALNEMQSLTESEYREDALVCLSKTHQQLGKQLGEQLGEQFGEEYELIGQIFGTYGGRWVFIPENKHMAWPEGTAVYVRRVKK